MTTKPFAINLIAAVSKNFVLGDSGNIPWHLAKDFAYFKKMTLNKPIIMGRKTFESIGRPLPKRLNIVLTRDTNYQAEGVCVCYDQQSALALAKDYYQNKPELNTDIMIIGGEQIYRLFLEDADKIYLTEIDLEVDGDTFFPQLNDQQWLLIQSVDESEQSNHKTVHFKFNTYQKNI